ncbi:MAG: hypothetical protein IT446_12220 [Phycisphaerales bacterium]|nr:hypothetical protein [Phycisphaerales bacterium]
MLSHAPGNFPIVRPDVFQPAAMVLWSDDALHRHLAEFPVNCDWSAHRLTWQLMQLGAPIQSVVDADAFQKADGPLLIPHPHLLDEPLRRRLLDSGRPLIAIGPDLTQWPQADLDWTDVHGSRPMECRLYNARCDVTFIADVAAAMMDQTLPSDPMEILDSTYFRWDLYFQPASQPFLAACAKLIQQVSGACSIESHKSREQPPGHQARLSLLMSERAPDTYRIAIKSNGDIYEHPTIDLGHPIHRIAVRTSFPVSTIKPDGSRFTLPIPPHGIVVVDVERSRTPNDPGSQE